ncbi:MAG TPA: hypothetical protein VF263_13980 [Longimicrobiaceae bacterium]
MSAPAAHGAPAGGEAVVIVDWTPTWVTSLYDRDVREAWQRLVSLLEPFLDASHGIPVIPVNAMELGRVSFNGIRTAYLTGIYGRLCVDTVAEHLRALGIEVVFVTDGIVWAEPGPPRDWQEEEHPHDRERYASAVTTGELAARWLGREAA